MMKLKLGKQDKQKQSKIEKKPKLLRILLFSKMHKKNLIKKESKEKLNLKLKLKRIEKLSSSKKKKNLRPTKGKLTWRRKNLKTR